VEQAVQCGEGQCLIAVQWPQLRRNGMNGHSPYLLAVLAILFAIVAFAAYRIIADRRRNIDHTGRRKSKRPHETGAAPNSSDEL
jgi:hypothetical protein